jgi:hypothetical protein
VNNDWQSQWTSGYTTTDVGVFVIQVRSRKMAGCPLVGGMPFGAVAALSKAGLWVGMAQCRVTSASMLYLTAG